MVLKDLIYINSKRENKASLACHGLSVRKVKIAPRAGPVLL